MPAAREQGISSRAEHVRSFRAYLGTLVALYNADRRSITASAVVVLQSYGLIPRDAAFDALEARCAAENAAFAAALRREGA